MILRKKYIIKQVITCITTRLDLLNKIWEWNIFPCASAGIVTFVGLMSGN